MAPGMEKDCVVKDAKKWEVEPERTASEFDAGYYGKLLEKAWEEVGFVFRQDFSWSQASPPSASWLSESMGRSSLAGYFLSSMTYSQWGSPVHILFVYLMVYRGFRLSTELWQKAWQ